MRLMFLVPVFTLILLKPSFAQSTAYYPLNVGDFWQYWDYMPVRFVTREVIKDTTLSNGKTYAAIQDDIFSKVIYQRTSGDSVFRFNTITDQDELFYDFSASPGDTIISIPNGSDTTDIVLLSKGMMEIFGVNRQHWDYLVDLNRYATDDEQFHTVVDSIGLSSVSSFGTAAEIRGAIINGIQYGTIININGNVTAMLNDFHLHQNYPNPFNPTTRIQYSIGRKQKVLIKIYDLLGKEIAILVDEEKPAGAYDVEFDASKLSSGIYFYQLQAGDFIETKKMILMR